MTKVLVCGSAVIDMVFDVPAFPDSAEKYQATDARIVGGGCAGNAAVAIARLGGQAVLAARAGQDLIGDMTRADLTREGVDAALWETSANGRSAFSSILVDPSGERQIVAFRGAGLPRRLGRPLVRADAVLTDTRWPEAAAQVLCHARELGVPGVLDGEAPVDPELLALATHVAFSAQGLRDFAGTDDKVAALKRVAPQTDAWVCVTDGPNGVTWLENGTVCHAAAPEITPVDTLGAGDVWHGAFTLALAEGTPLPEAVIFATAAATLKCLTPGGRSGAPDRVATLEFIERMQN
ncbi:PfkB family carbohydrate kinase [Oceanibium sediminis]|uniref:PfkB family carbohydrate kinase n=1 Tax=Oceanibium sediminis TaxID=2026339 RepID=UPI000DD31D0D|nr:PfkB family carbohydrate kinase [Oceanibium sediminis]